MIKPSMTIICAGIVGLGVLGVFMINTNPSQPQYEQYASLKLTEYLKANICNKYPNLLQSIIKFDCEYLLKKANPYIKDLISTTTQRQNYVLFSMYRTNLKLSSLLPAYAFESVGAFENFYTYKAEKQ